MILKNDITYHKIKVRYDKMKYIGNAEYSAKHKFTRHLAAQPLEIMFDFKLFHVNTK
jgi:hypothetical protein